MARRICLFTLALAVCMSAGAVDVPLPGINLGATSFEDGGGGVGTLLQWSASQFDASRTYDAAGRRVPLPYRRDLQVHRLHYAYTARTRWLGGNVGAELLLPITRLRLHAGAARIEGSGAGNLNAGVYVQWLGRTWLGKPFDSRLSLIAALPWGQYGEGRSFNAGSPYASFNPYYAFTWRATGRWEVSGRLLYLWNGVSHRPSTALSAQAGRPVRSLRAGQAFHYNLSASYALAPQWRVGAGLYQLLQTSADQIGGRVQGGSKERLSGFGPGVQWRRRQHRVVSNFYIERDARNRAAGTQFVLRYMYVY